MNHISPAQWWGINDVPRRSVRSPSSYGLVCKADVTFDNDRLGVTKRLTIDRDTLSTINAHIFTCWVSELEETGPGSNRPSLSMVVQDLSISRFEDSPPVRSGIPIGEIVRCAEFTQAMDAFKGKTAKIARRR